MDARLHYLQGKTELVKATELLALLRDFYRDKLTMRQRHVAVAKHVPDYDFNNTYQYVIAREDMQLGWLRDAITDMGGALEELPEPTIEGSGKDASLQARLIGEDRGIGNLLDKSEAKYRCGYPEDHIVHCQFVREVWLSN